MQDSTSVDLDNPELLVHEVECHGERVRVVRDDELVAGSKQRGIVAFVRRLASALTDELLYAGPTTGHAQVALAYAAQRTGMKATLFVALTRPRNALTVKAESMGCRVVELPRPNALRDVQQRAAAYHAIDPARRLLLPFGLHAPEFIDEMAASVSAALPRSLRLDPPRRVWVACGSATLLAALARVWPDALLFGVQVGKWVTDELLGTSAAIIMTAPEFFTDTAELPPPHDAYASVESYDAKVWQFVLRHANRGDLVWNVARDPSDAARADSSRTRESLLRSLPPVLPLPPFGHHQPLEHRHCGDGASSCAALLARLRWSSFDVRRIALVAGELVHRDLRACFEKALRLLDTALETNRVVPRELCAELQRLLQPLAPRRWERLELPFYRRLQLVLLDAVLLLKLAHGHTARHKLANELSLFGGPQAVFDGIARLFNARDLAFPLFEAAVCCSDSAPASAAPVAAAIQSALDGARASATAIATTETPTATGTDLHLGTLVELLSERARLQARVAPGASARPLDMFHRREALQKIAERCHEQHGALHMPTLREMFLARASENLWLFEPRPVQPLQLALELTRRFEATHIFDAEIGWGERLLAARIGGQQIRYVGRHNGATCAPTREHLRFFEAPHHFTVLDATDALPPSLAVDLAFVAPLPLQSSGAWIEDLQHWSSMTLRAYCREAWSILAPGGTLVLALSARVPKRLFSDVVAFVSRELADSQGHSSLEMLLGTNTAYQSFLLHCWTRPLTGSIRTREDALVELADQPAKKQAKAAPPTL